MKNEDLKGTFAIIGASGGIGSRLCHILAENGADLFLGSRTVDQQIELPDGTRAEKAEVDETDWDSIDRFFEQAREFGEPIAGVALCVGSILLKPAHQTSKAEFDETIMIALQSVAHFLIGPFKQLAKFRRISNDRSVH